jgi:hypothetical protein
VGAIGQMQVKILYFNGCPMWETAAARIRTVLAELGRPGVVVQLEDVHQVPNLSAEWAGSPTLLLDGRDPFAVADGPSSHPVTARDACRIYVTEAGFEGAPSVDQLRTVLTRVLRDDTTLRRS